MEICELFLFKADWQRTYIGSINRSKDTFGRPIIYGKVDVNGMIYSFGITDDDIGSKMDQMIKLKLDYEIHTSNTSNYKVLDYCFNLN